MIVNVVVEGRSDLGAAEAILRYSGHEPGALVDKRGKSNLDPDIHKYNEAARWEPWVVIRDTDGACPVDLRAGLVTGVEDLSPLFQLRLAHSMTEAWLLADRAGFADYFHVSVARIPPEPEVLTNAKRAVLDLCRRSRSRYVREAMVTSGGEVGPLYVSTVNDFALNHWDVAEAADNSESLRRALERIASLGENQSHQ